MVVFGCLINLKKLYSRVLGSVEVVLASCISYGASAFILLLMVGSRVLTFVGLSLSIDF